MAERPRAPQKERSPRAIDGEPIIRWTVRRLIDRPIRSTLLAVCPNSRAVARAALQAAHEANAPALFAATLNQVDVERSYTDFTPETLVTSLKEEAGRIGFDGPVLVGLDHGGPWQKDWHVIDDYDYEATMQAVKRSIEACLDAGYAQLHIDPTVDRRLPDDEAPAVEWVADRTVELIQHAEQYRERAGYPPVSYEVGTEEVGLGPANPEAVSTFLKRLDARLRDAGLLHAWPCFVVGRVGTELHTGHFDAEAARQLRKRVASYGALIKGHYTDYVDHPEEYPLAGMGGANVGPGFADIEYQALMELVSLEQKLGKSSDFQETLRRAVVQSGRWKKWLQPDEQGKAFDQLAPERQEWLVRTGSRYVWTKPEVEIARGQLYYNVSAYCDPDAFVVWRIKSDILEYMHAFNLINFNDRVFPEDIRE